MKTIGIIGGMSPESTVVYYQTINREINRRLGGNRSADILVRNNSVYLPAAFFRNLGYTVTWNSANRSVTVAR